MRKQNFAFEISSSSCPGNALLVAMIKLLEDYQSSILPVQPWHCLAILTTLEVIIILTVLIWYLGKVYCATWKDTNIFLFEVITIKFNKERAYPDATQDDILSSFVTPQTSANEIGFRFVDTSWIRPWCCLFFVLVMKLTRKMFWKNKLISFVTCVNATNI